MLFLYNIILLILPNSTKICENSKLLSISPNNSGSGIIKVKKLYLQFIRSRSLTEASFSLSGKKTPLSRKRHISTSLFRPPKPLKVDPNIKRPQSYWMRITLYISFQRSIFCIIVARLCWFFANSCQMEEDNGLNRCPKKVSRLFNDVHCAL